MQNFSQSAAHCRISSAMSVHNIKKNTHSNSRRKICLDVLSLSLSELHPSESVQFAFILQRAIKCVLLHVRQRAIVWMENPIDWHLLLQIISALLLSWSSSKRRIDISIYSYMEPLCTRNFRETLHVFVAVAICGRASVLSWFHFIRCVDLGSSFGANAVGTCKQNYSIKIGIVGNKLQMLIWALRTLRCGLGECSAVGKP